MRILPKKNQNIIAKKYSDKKLLQLFNKAVNKYPEEWLILYELLEISNLYSNIKLSNKIKKSLNKFINNQNPESKVIKRGLDLIK